MTLWSGKGCMEGFTWTGLGSVPAGLTVRDGSVAGAVTNDDPSDAGTGLRGSAAPACTVASRLGMCMVIYCEISFEHAHRSTRV